MSDGFTRRRFLFGAGGFLLLGAAGCGGSGGDSGEETASGQTVAIEHKFGTTEIEGVPERVVSVGYTDQDAIIALGVVPVGMARWSNDRAVWPWNEQGLNGEEPETFVAGEPNFEQIATLSPDLIVGLSSGMTQDMYETFSEIAPTIDHTDEYPDFGVPWQETTRVVGEALSRQDRAEDLVADVEGQFEEARRQHPEFEGKSAVVVLPAEGGAFYPYASTDARARFMTALGFEIPQQIDEIAGDQFYATISGEEIDLLDADVLIWLIQSEEQRESIRNNELYQQLDVVRQGRDLFFSSTLDDEPIAPAFSYGTVLSLPYLIENLVPQIAAVFEGESAEETTG